MSDVWIFEFKESGDEEGVIDLALAKLAELLMISVQNKALPELKERARK